MQNENTVKDRSRNQLALNFKRFLQRIGLKKRNEAQEYVGTDAVSGELQLELLKREGCEPDSKVLEVGCGHLHLGIPLMQYLGRSKYVGIDPNEWLRQDAMKDDRIRQLVAEKDARFLSSETFDASELGIQFDFIFSHSVLSHGAHWQLGQFLENAAKVLAPDGRILSSIRLAEGNDYGSEGSPDKKDSMDEEWVYPGNSYFTLETVTKAAEQLGLSTIYKPEYTEFYTQTRPKEFHDWVVFYR